MPQHEQPPTNAVPRRAVVTGSAGFIGSHLAHALVQAGTTVIGVDRRDPSTDPTAAANLAALRGRQGYHHVTADLLHCAIDPLLINADAVFHLAGIPGVRPSWGPQFGDYLASNVLATHRVLEASTRIGVPRLVVASSSSVYGPTDGDASLETDRPNPASPYAVTKLAEEQLCLAYAGRPGGPSVVALRYFTVYGPRQRADMFTHRALYAALTGQPLRLYGDGHQRRDFTYIDDVVAATIAAGTVPNAHGPINVGGGSNASLLDVINIANSLTGREIQLHQTTCETGTSSSRAPTPAVRERSSAGSRASTSTADCALTCRLWPPRYRTAAGPRSPTPRNPRGVSMETPERARLDAFFRRITAQFPAGQAITTLVITHLLPERPAFLHAMAAVSTIGAVLPKPRSIHQPTLDTVRRTLPVHDLSRERFTDETQALHYLEDTAGGRGVVLVDIGGYFASSLDALVEKFSGRILGVVEDTENGHQRYAALGSLPCPVVSVARSPLKDCEDHLVGRSIVFSTDALVRARGDILTSRSACVIGFGKIGRSIAQTLRAQTCASPCTTTTRSSGYRHTPSASAPARPPPRPSTTRNSSFAPLAISPSGTRISPPCATARTSDR